MTVVSLDTHRAAKSRRNRCDFCDGVLLLDQVKRPNGRWRLWVAARCKRCGCRTYRAWPA